MKKSLSINFFYFFLIGAAIFISSILHPLLDSHFQKNFLFYFLTFLQTTLEVSLLFSIGAFFKKKLPNFLSLFYFGLLFFLPIIHLANFFILRILDSNLSYAFQFIFSQNSLSEFWIALRATGLNLAYVGLIAILLAAIPFMGIFIYKITEKKFSKKISYKPLLFTALCSCLLLLPLEKFSISQMPYDTYHTFEKKLPFCRTLVNYPLTTSLNVQFKKPRDNKTIENALKHSFYELEKKSNIYLFIVESFRKDYLNEETTPHLAEFQQNHPSPEQSFSNANASHMSWFSILHSNYPYYWNHENPDKAMGSIPLNLLKSLGYKIHVISSAELTYYQNDLRLFGNNHHLVDSFEYLTDKEACVRDEKTIKKLLDQNQEKEGHCYIIFLDSPHSEYSFPENQVIFKPITDSINYLGLGMNAISIDPIQNRYRNSLHYVDSLLGNFFQDLKTKDFYEDSIIVITGDHGEEFYEEGSLFHASHLNTYQTSVPIFYKLGNEPLYHQNYLSCHMNIFPTILHYLTGVETFDSLFDGKSLLSLEEPQTIFIANQNSSYAPDKFLIKTENFKIIFKYDPLKNNFTLLSIKDNFNVPVTVKNMNTFLKSHLDITNNELFIPTDSSASITKN